MAQITITINSREYPIACEDGQEAKILKLANLLEEKAQILKNISGQINENMLLIMIGILIADDLYEIKNSNSQNNQNNNELVQKFEELDNIISNKLKTLNNEIKSVANEIKSM